jgi:arginine N-succinyltransferase
MSIYIRQSRKADLDDLFELARQFVLLNLPADKAQLSEILEKSDLSFKGELENSKREYLFVVEDSEVKKIVGASKIVAKHGTLDEPHLYYKIDKKEKFSSDLGLGFIHQILSFKEDYDGPTELGGLIVDKAYRRRSEKVGKSVSLVRFMYIAAHLNQFEEQLHCEMAPPLTSEGRSEFWEALGRRFTGLPYEEADRLSHTNKEFIKSLFPEDEIYMTLLESKARLVVGEVGEETKPARALMEKLGFVYKSEVDPFDGGPHLGVRTVDARPIKAFVKGVLNFKSPLNAEKKMFLVGGFVSGEFRAKLSFVEFGKNDENEMINISVESNKELMFQPGQEVFTIPMDY